MTLVFQVEEGHEMRKQISLATSRLVRGQTVFGTYEVSCESCLPCAYESDGEGKCFRTVTDWKTSTSSL